MAQCDLTDKSPALRNPTSIEIHICHQSWPRWCYPKACSASKSRSESSNSPAFGILSWALDQHGNHQSHLASMATVRHYLWWPNWTGLAQCPMAPVPATNCWLSLPMLPGVHPSPCRAKLDRADMCPQIKQEQSGGKCYSISSSIQYPWLAVHFKVKHISNTSHAHRSFLPHHLLLSVQHLPLRNLSTKTSIKSFDVVWTW